LKARQSDSAELDFLKEGIRRWREQSPGPAEA
jgi:hypothetical protein